MGISDTTWIAGLLVIALFISAIGTFTAFSKFSPTGFATSQSGTTNATVTGTVVLAMVVDSIDFGSIAVGASKDTTGDSPIPFKVRNDGNVNINVTLNSTNLWSQAAVTSDKYQFKCGNDNLDCPANSVVAWTDMPINAAQTLVIADQTWATGDDVLQVEIKITAPVDEPAGAKSATVYFTASQA